MEIPSMNKVTVNGHQPEAAPQLTSSFGNNSIHLIGFLISDQMQKSL